MIIVVVYNGIKIQQPSRKQASLNPIFDGLSIKFYVHSNLKYNINFDSYQYTT